jgi:hypothetical protein
VRDGNYYGRVDELRESTRRLDVVAGAGQLARLEGPLGGIFCAYFPDEKATDPWPEAFQLHFGDLVALIEVDIDTDELKLQILRRSECLPTTAVSHQAPWSDVIGMHVLWAWGLTNNQGYLDGLEIEFYRRDKERAKSTTLRFLGIASGIDVARVDSLANWRFRHDGPTSRG